MVPEWLSRRGVAHDVFNSRDSFENRKRMTSRFPSYVWADEDKMLMTDDGADGKTARWNMYTREAGTVKPVRVENRHYQCHSSFSVGLVA